MRFARKKCANPLREAWGHWFQYQEKERTREEDQEPLVAKTLYGVGEYFFCSKIVRNKKNPHPPSYAKGCGKGEDGFRKSFLFLTLPVLAIGE
jgi:hypothetical protein